VSDLTGKTTLVTGSSRGIGAAIARSFAQHGARVVIHGRDRDAVSRVRAEVERDGGTAIEQIADLTRFDDIERMRQDIERTLGPVEILVANAGGNLAKPAPLEEIAEDAWRATVDTNLTATFLTLKSFLPGMKTRRRGTIVTMSSAAARRPHPSSPIAYAAAKAGIQLLTQDVAAQAGPFGVRVNCIAPETILTDRNREQIPVDVQETLIDTHPIRRLGQPDDVARAALYLVSDDAAWVSGIVLDIAGGAVMV
jgi:3-oxoacyl-[acyl-carrier protein] reductase